MRQYALATVALAANVLQLIGVYWDVGWHHAFPGVRETFWSRPHMAISAGVAVALVAAVLGLFRGDGAGGRTFGSFPGGPYRVAVLGPAMQIVAAPFDELWHQMIGQDVSIWSPPHLLGILGGMVGVLGWILVLVAPRRDGMPGALRRGLVFEFAVLLLAGALFALGEYDHDQAARGPWLYPVLVGLLATWILVGARTWIGWAWAGTLVALGYTVVRSAVAAGVWGMGLPWMGVPPPIVLGALSLDLFLARRGPGVAGALFGIVFTVSDFPVTAILSGRSWTGLEFAGTQVAAAAAGWVSAVLGQRLLRRMFPRFQDVAP